jgi:hypothetical protein
MELKCECGSKYFTEVVVSSFKEGNLGPTTALRSLLNDPWKIYKCINSKCEKIYIPELTTFSMSKRDMRAYQEILSTEKGDPIELIS